MKKYIVCWVKRFIPKNGRLRFQSDYSVYVDGSSDENYQEALKKYNSLKELDTLYSANICEIIESTDY